MAGSPPPGHNNYPPQGQQGYPPQNNPYGSPQASSPTQPQQGAPYGVHPNGIPYSDKQRQLAGFLQLLPIVIGIGGIGRFYAGQVGLGVAQLILCCTGIGQLWSIIDGILYLVDSDTGKYTDAEGRPLRPN